MSNHNANIVIVGGGIAGLACARQLHTQGYRFTLFEATGRIGGRVKTDRRDGYLLDRGFQVLQTAYPEAQRVLDYPQLNLCNFAPGAVIRRNHRFHTIADPVRRPQHLLSSLAAPIGTLTDRLRLLRLAHRVTQTPLENLFQAAETSAIDFLRSEGFSARMINCFFRPFFGGVCLDRNIGASSRVLLYVLRMFAAGDAALPAAGMEQIPRQLADGLPADSIRTGVRVRAIAANSVILNDGTTLSPQAIVVATEAPATLALMGASQTIVSRPEICIYFVSEHIARQTPFLVLNGDGSGPINNVAFPSAVSPQYAPPGKSLVSVVILDQLGTDDAQLLPQVQAQLFDWFGAETHHWRHLATYRIAHALPDQAPPTKDPTRVPIMVQPGLFIAGEHLSLPGTQWALLSGRRSAEAVIAYLAHNR